MIDGALDRGGAVYGQYSFRQFAEFAADFRFTERCWKSPRWLSQDLALWRPSVRVSMTCAGRSRGAKALIAGSSVMWTFGRNAAITVSSSGANRRRRAPPLPRASCPLKAGATPRIRRSAKNHLRQGPPRRIADLRSRSPRHQRTPSCRRTLGRRLPRTLKRLKSFRPDAARRFREV